MAEYNFDPFTGQPIRKEPEVQIPQPVEDEQKQEVAAELPTPPVAEPMQEKKEQFPNFTTVPFTAPLEQPKAAPVQSSAVKEEKAPKGKGEKKVKEKKFISRGAFTAVVALLLIFSMVMTAGGVFLTLKLVPQMEQDGANVSSEDSSEGKDENSATPPAENTVENIVGSVSGEGLTVPQVAALVKDSVVEITTEKIVTGTFMQQYVSEGAGSGVIYTTDGYIVTNHHVVEGATNIKVRLADGKGYEAKLIGSDAKSDLAVLKIEGKNLKAAAFGDSSKVCVGETVVVVGNPLGELGGTVTSGIVSALDRSIAVGNTTMNLLQTDTAINPGNSGGGMFNAKGELVGVINAKSAGEEIEGLGFAIPVNTAKKVIDDLTKLGYVSGRVDPGLVYVEVSDSLTAMMYQVSELGLYISETKKGSDGEKAGFKSGDYVVSIDGQPVTSEIEANAIIDSKKVGDKVKFEVKRNGKIEKIEMTLSEHVPE